MRNVAKVWIRSGWWIALFVADEELPVAVDASTRIIRRTVNRAVAGIRRDPRASPALSRHADAVAILLNDIMTSVLSGDGWPGPLVVVSMCRRLHIDRAGLDLLAHHALTALVAQHPGPEALVRAGATFAAASCHLPPRVGGPGPASVTANHDKPAHRPIQPHLPMPPTWTCSGCAHDWPCATKQSQLLVEFGGTRPALGIYLGSCLSAAMFDLPATDKRVLQHRFMGWLPRGSWG